MQLNKFLAHAGICSRRKAVDLIRSQRVTVNGIVASHPGFRVSDTAKVAIDGEGIGREEKIYIALHKPRGYVTTNDDERNRKVVSDLISGKAKRRLYPVGRLDKDTSGLLLMTNDGNFSASIAHPRNNVSKKYRIIVDRPFLQQDLEQVRQGVRLSDGMLRVDQIEYEKSKRRYTHLLVTLHSGKNRILRRLMEHFSYKIIVLERIAIGSVGIGDLAVGKWRYMTSEEISYFISH